MILDAHALLFRHYPQAFRKPLGFPDPDLDQEPMAPIDYRGIECGDGWTVLIASMADQLERYLAKPGIAAKPAGDRPRFLQVKEKFGTLRFYISHRGDLPPEIQAAIDATESASATCCERCGAPGILHTTGYRHVACERCLAAAPATAADYDWDAHLAALKVLLAGRISG